ncbi:MAG TPA: hypothetical protein VK578_10210 [Edaphobacter sp.]|nr:hypothetical protein [Edaphobacter sp.]
MNRCERMDGDSETVRSGICTAHDGVKKKRLWSQIVDLTATDTTRYGGARAMSGIGQRGLGNK